METWIAWLEYWWAKEIRQGGLLTDSEPAAKGNVKIAL
jgi:hypothetical protein